ncbi:MAG TPA: YIP1 family protein [Bryobacteraceae bacterium]|nr:YIP1 family protein [Bryobacteraceae bacterium]
MEEARTAVQEQKPGIGAGLVGMLNVFIDPKATAQRIAAPFAWIWPLITLCIIYGVVGVFTSPYAQSIVDAQIAQRGVTGDQAEAARRLGHVIAQITPILTPVAIILFLFLFAWLVMVVGSIAGVRAKFRDIYSLMACCTLIPALQAIATVIVLRAKGDEITSQEQLTPPFGLDIFFPNMHGALYALLNFFSIFEVWYLIVFTVGLAALAKTTKGKAFFAITPAWVLTLLIRVIQGMFQNPQS